MYKAVINSICILLLIPIFNLVFEFVGDIPSSEKKKEITIGDIIDSDFKKKFNLIEEAFERKFPARNWIIQKYNFFLWFMLESTPKRTVLRGQNNWLYIFLGKGANGRDYSYNESDFLAYKQGLEKLKNLCVSRNIKFYSAIVPEKFNIYPESLNWYDHSTIRSDKYFRIFNELAKTSEDTVFFHEELLSRKKSHNVYYKTDTHWNSVAAFDASNKLFAKMAQENDKIDPLREKEFNLIHIISSGRDIAEYLSLPRFFLDEEYVYIPNSNFMQRKNKLRVLVIHDSYFYPMFDFFRYQFAQVDVWNFVQKENPLNYDELLKFKPDILIFILLERHIGNYDKRVFGHL
ncbi:alginate biosynthesis protein [Leptospira mtsangambouensis]|uniref:Alginate biosynthesis protein n=1 Tax=Leptospira mtsangambouensis TaxID=2484912 RepID=A0ABY2P491_9LEPT|nr:alginate biosynthesis protein [Leptospira mtsangambouensis]TGM82256.1 alginate biosynthesis protein [Leptospira mtsangambouensis]